MSAPRRPAAPAVPLAHGPRLTRAPDDVGGRARTLSSIPASIPF